MYNLPIGRNNESWSKINYQFLKGGFNWYNQKIPDWRRWYYKYYLSEEKYCCLKIARNRRNKVTCWLRNIEKFEKIKEKYEQEDRENTEKKDREKKDREKEDKKEDKKEEKWWLRRWGDSNNSMSWRRTKYGQ